MGKDIIIGRKEIEEAFGFPLYHYHWKKVKAAGIIFRKRFGRPPKCRFMIYTYRGLIYLFLREGGFE